MADRWNQHTRGGVLPVLALLLGATAAGCAGTPDEAGVAIPDDVRGYQGVVLQTEGLEKPATAREGGGTAAFLMNIIWFPWRLSYGILLFAVAGDAGPIPLTGFRWLSSETSPWLLGPGEYFVAEDAYAAGEWPARANPLIGIRGSDPDLLPSRADP